MLANAKKMVTSLTEVAIALLALAIVASVLVGPDNMAFLGDVVGNITALVQQLGSAGLAGLIALGVVLALFHTEAICKNRFDPRSRPIDPTLRQMPPAAALRACACRGSHVLGACFPPRAIPHVGGRLRFLGGQ